MFRVAGHFPVFNEEIVDFKKHVLDFCNTQDNGLAIALNGFQELKMTINQSGAY